MTDSMDVLDADFTPNPDRAIWIQGEFAKALLDRLEPQILSLTSQSRKPITVFIDSRGGSAALGERILDLLRSAGENGAAGSTPRDQTKSRQRAPLSQQWGF